MYKLPHTFVKIPLLLMAILLVSACKKDEEAPIFQLQGTPQNCFAVGEPFEEPDFTVTDNEDCCLADQVSVSGAVNTAAYGKYNLTYSVADQAGNLGLLDFEVIVKLAKANYHSLEYNTDDQCDGVSFDYLASIQDCDCPENKVQLINLGNFGPGTILDVNLSGDFNEIMSFDQNIGGLQFTGTGQASSAADTLYLSYSVSDTAGTTQNCEAALVKN